MGKETIKNLKCLSLRNNNIDNFPKQLINNFPQLKKLDLRHNNIFSIPQTLTADRFIILDLSYNNLSFYNKFKNLIVKEDKKNKLIDNIPMEDTIVFLAGNLGLMHGNDRNQYCKYLHKKITGNYYGEKSRENKDKMLADTYEFRSLMFDSVFAKNIHILEAMDLSVYRFTLTELSLAYTNLTCENLINILGKSNEKIFRTLKKLDLSYNNFGYKNNEEDDFSCKAIKAQLYNNLPMLEYLDLSGNKVDFRIRPRKNKTTKADIHYDKKYFQNFVDKFPCLRTMVLKYTDFEDEVSLYLKEKVRRFFEAKNAANIGSHGPKQFKGSLLQVKLLIDNDEHYLKNKDLTLIFVDMIKKKYTEKIKKYFPDLLDRIILEEHFSD